MNGSQMVPLGRVLTIDQDDEVLLEPDETYRTAGIYSFGRGVFERQPIRGTDTSYTSLFRIHENQFILSRLNGWEGAVDVVSAELDGCLVSNEYPTFAIDSDLAYPGYLRWITRWSRFWEQLVPRGSMVRRKRVKLGQLLEVEIPLPPISNQRVIANKFDALFQNAGLGLKRLAHAGQQQSRLVEVIIQQRFDSGVAHGWPMLPLEQIATVNPTPARLDADTLINFVAMSAVDKTVGQITQPELRTVADLKGSYKQFCKGDVIFARITPCMQNGKTAVVSGLSTNYGYGSTEFHVIRPGNLVTADWLHQIFRTSSFKAAAARHFIGTAGQQRVPASFLREHLVPVPPIAEQHSAVAILESLLRRNNRLTKYRALQRARFVALQASFLNEAFAGMM